mgnify:CR=1 FL=1
MVKHSKRNKSGHRFSEGHIGAGVNRRQVALFCKCGLTLYDWQCKWLWS